MDTVQTDASAPDASAVSSPAEKAVAELEAWFVRHIHDSAISVKTELFNRVQAIKDSLKSLMVHLDL